MTDHATEERVLVATRETGEFVGEMSVGSAALTRAESAGSTGVEGSSKKKGSTSAKSGGAPDSPSSMSSFQATLAAKIADIEVTRTHDLSAPQGVRGRNSDNTMILDLMGWEPDTPLADGLAVTYEWIEQQMAAG